MRVLKARAVRAVGMISAGTVQSMRRILSCLEADASADSVVGVHFAAFFTNTTLGRGGYGDIWMASDRRLMYMPYHNLCICVLPDVDDLYAKYMTKALAKYRKLGSGGVFRIGPNICAGRLADFHLRGSYVENGFFVKIGLHLSSVSIDSELIPISKDLKCDHMSELVPVLDVRFSVVFCDLSFIHNPDDNACVILNSDNVMLYIPIGNREAHVIPNIDNLYDKFVTYVMGKCKVSDDSFQTDIRTGAIVSRTKFYLEGYDCEDKLRLKKFCIGKRSILELDRSIELERYEPWPPSETYDNVSIESKTQLARYTPPRPPGTPI